MTSSLFVGFGPEHTPAANDALNRDTAFLVRCLAPGEEVLAGIDYLSPAVGYAVTEMRNHGRIRIDPRPVDGETWLFAVGTAPAALAVAAE